MSSHAKLEHFGNSPITYSKLATKYIRNKMKFKGLLVTDDLSMQALDPLPMYQRARYALLSGYDLLIFNDPKALKKGALQKTIQLLIGDIHSGKLSRIHVEHRVRKILKIRRGLDKKPKTKN